MWSIFEDIDLPHTRSSASTYVDRTCPTMANKMPMVAPIYLPGKEPLPPGLTEEHREQLRQTLKYQGYVVSAMESCVGKAAISGVLGFGLGAFFSLMSASFSIDDPLRQTMIDRAAAEQAQKLQQEEEAKKARILANGSKSINATVQATTASTNASVNTPKSALSATGIASNLGHASNAPLHQAAPKTATQKLLTKLPGSSYFKDLPPPPPQLPAQSMQSTKEFFIQTGRSMYSSGKGFGKVGALYSGIECCVESYRAKNDMVNPVLGGFLAGGILARNTGPMTAFSSAMAFAAFSGAIDLFLRRETKDED